MTGDDDYLLGHGDSGYSVRHYDLSLAYTVHGNHLSAKATLRATALTRTDQVTLDLRGLSVDKLVFDGTRAHYTHRGGRIVIRPPAALSPGQDFTVTVTYAGNPLPVRGIDGEAGWEELTDGVIVAAQPHGASSWFPCNDRPSDKASYRIELTTATAYHVSANGNLAQRRRGASRTTWVFDQPEPMATYLATVQIGRYQEQVLATTPVPIISVRPPALAARVDNALARQAEMMGFFCQLFGPYPFGQYTVVVTQDELEIPIESQGLSTFGANHASTDWSSQRLVAHELAHQWFGNSLTLRSWRDIWLHEGFACYSEWLWSEVAGNRTAHQQAVAHWTRLSKLPQDVILTNPGPCLMFDDRIYKRGALALHALRLHLGDPAFFAVLRSWAEHHRHGTVTTGMFLSHVNEAAGRSATVLLDDWLFAAPLPTLPRP
ncbi:MAG TPA: M1 family metallopeptidase [Pedococcus sp.]|nr:M1 family metallopeptidase [Pedococcus sp.]